LLYNAANLLNPGGSATLLSLLAQLSSLTFVPPPSPLAALAGDFNLDGDVNAADYVVWRKQVSANVAPDNDSPFVAYASATAEDYDVWKTNFGTTAGAQASSTAAASSIIAPVNDSPAATFATGLPVSGQHSRNSRLNTTIQDEVISRRVADAAFDQLTTSERWSSKVAVNRGVHRKSRTTLDSPSNVNTHRNVQLLDRHLSQYRLPFAGRNSEGAGSHEIDHIFDEFATMPGTRQFSSPGDSRLYDWNQSLNS
jgi:hypothetical protein